MTVADFLANSHRRLIQANIASARLDTLLLLEDILEIDRSHILAHVDQELTSKQVAELSAQVEQRMQHHPLAYIRGVAEFYGRKFTVTPDVLIPRPETESIISLMLASNTPPQPRIADVGTGSGCLGITAALEIPTATVSLIDIKESALVVAGRNANLHKAQISLLNQSLLGNSEQIFDIILANLPYVPEHFPINEAAAFEPAIAIFAGKDGMRLYNKLWTQIGGMQTAPPRQVYTESLSFQHLPMMELAKSAGYHLVQTEELVQHFEHI